jgi:hypothetical protein
MQESDDFASCKPNSLVQGIIDSVVRLTYQTGNMSSFAPNNRDRLIARSAVDNYVFDVFVSLARYRAQGITYRCRAVIRYGNGGDPNIHRTSFC